MGQSKLKTLTVICSICSKEFTVVTRATEPRKTCGPECSSISRVRANEKRIKEAGFNFREPAPQPVIETVVVKRRRKLTRQQELLNKAKRFAGAKW